MAYIVYILECADGTLYTGITTDLARRFKQHQSKKGGAYTQAHPVRKILYQEQVADRSIALRREAEIKKLEREEKLLLISEGQATAAGQKS